MVGSSETRDIWDILSDGGALVTQERTGDGDYRLSISKYDPLSDPRGALSIASFLAREARELSPTVVVAWEDLEDAVLAFAVGAELGTPVVRAFDVEGLVRHIGRMPAQPRGILVTDAIREDNAIEALKALLAQMGGMLSGVVSVVDLGDVVTDLPVNSLVSASDGPMVEHEGG
jgi:hypothetical protein